MCCSGINLDGNVIGIAPMGTMCKGSTSAGLTQGTGSSLAFVASTAAHELGHIFNMYHDNGRKWTFYIVTKATCLRCSYMLMLHCILYPIGRPDRAIYYYTVSYKETC